MAKSDSADGQENKRLEAKSANNRYGGHHYRHLLNLQPIN